MVYMVCDCLKGDESIFAVEANGGTGKTYCISTIAAILRSKGNIVLLMAITASAATFFDRGRTAHYKLKIPIKVNETTTCNIKAKSATAKIIERAKLIVIDEYTMGNKHLYETIDRSLRDLLNVDLPYGGKIVLHSGDWKQNLPVVRGGSRADIVEATLKSSYLWDFMKLFKLTVNVRIQNAKSEDAEEYNKYLIDVGQGRIEIDPEIQDSMIKIPDKMKSASETFEQFTREIFPDLGNKVKTAWKERDLRGPTWNQYVHDRVIICPRNQDVEEINNICLDMMYGEPVEFLSADRCIQEANEVSFPPEFLNRQTPPGTANHRIVLKVGCPIMLMRNLDPLNGHVNGAQ